jgi:osmotically-inducible protein OsmY
MVKARRIVLQSWLAALALVALGAPSACGQASAKPAKETSEANTAARPEIAILNAIRAHPLTAPYPITTSWQKGAVVLSGRVGTKQVHDLAIAMAIESGVPFRDNLVIDTGTAALAAQSAAAADPAAAAIASTSLYIYPPPLMGRLDDPFFGFVPPLLSFPPWWRRQVESPPAVAPRTVPGNAAGATAAAAAGPENAPRHAQPPFDDPAVKGQVEITVDSAGQVFLRGVVTSEQSAREIEETARSVPGVTHVDSQLQVQVVPRRAEAEKVPPPPEPVLPAPSRERAAPPSPERAAPKSPAPAVVPARAKPADDKPASLDAHVLTKRVVDSLERRPAAADLPVKVRSSDGVVTLAGHVPSAFEAMLVYRAAEQTPGVRDVVDRLEFTVPDDDHPNPLLHRGRPEDLEPYLAAQIRRHVGDLAHVDRIHARGNVLEVRGSLLDARDRDRLLAILRSIPVLHGFRLEPEFTVD